MDTRLELIELLRERNHVLAADRDAIAEKIANLCTTDKRNAAEIISNNKEIDRLIRKKHDQDRTHYPYGTG